MALKLKGSTSGFVAIDAPSVAGNNTLILPENTGSAQQLLGNDITAGVVTFTSVTVNRNGDLTVPGTISIGGTLTYEDVTSVDSVGIVTARSGVRINGGGLTIIGDTTGLKATGISTLVDVSARNITGVAATFTGALSGTTASFNSGTTNTVATFTSSDSGAVINITDNSARSSIEQNGTDLKIISDTDASDADSTIKFQVDASTKAIINSSGYFGLGTNTPTGTLSIASGTFQTTTPTSTGDDIVISGNQSLGIQFLTLASGTSNNNIFFGDTDDPDIGRLHYAHADNSMRFRTNGSEKMQIDSSGNLLMGTTTAAISGGIGILIANSAGSRIKLCDSDAGVTAGDGFELIASDNATAYVWNRENTSLLFGTNNTERMQITADGKVGINENSPDNLLHITDGNPYIEIEGTSNSGDAGIFLNAKANHWIVRADNSGSQNIFSIKDGTPASSTHRVAINASGYMALGNTSPQQLLHVWPDIANTTSAYMRVTAGDRASTTGLQIGHDLNGNFQIQGVSNGSMYWSTNNAVRMSLKNDSPDLVVGNVGGWTDYSTAQGVLMAYATSTYNASGHAIKALHTNVNYTEDGGGIFFIGARRATTADFTMAGWYTGNGSTSVTTDRQFRFIADGNAYADGSWNGGGADYAEFFEWLDGNSSDEDRKGISVVLDNGKIRAATGSDNTDNIIGVISANPVVVGDSASERWKEKWITDDFGAPVYEEYTITEWYDETKKEKVNYDTDRIPSDVTVGAGSSIITTNENGTNLKRKKLNPSWDPTATYIPRKDRKEWDIVGLMGKLKVKSDQPIGTKWIKMREISASVHEYLIR